MCGHTYSNTIRNEDIQNKVKVANVVDKMRKENWDGVSIWREDMQMTQWGGVRDWIQYLRGEPDADQRSIEEMWLDKTWCNFSLSKTWA